MLKRFYFTQTAYNSVFAELNSVLLLRVRLPKSRRTLAPPLHRHAKTCYNDYASIKSVIRGIRIHRA